MPQSELSEELRNPMQGTSALGMATASTSAAAIGLVPLQLSCRGNVMRERIFRDLVAFAESRDELALLQNLPKTPKGVSIEWLRLYEEVVRRGGFEHVCQQRLWGEIIARECMAIDIMPYVLASYYERFLYPFEAKQLFGREIPSAGAGSKRPSPEAIASVNELQEAQSVGGTPLPPATKRLKVQRQLRSDLGTMHGLVLALDSDLPPEVSRALNLLSVLSYGNPSDAESEMMVDAVPGLLDALYRQLQACRVLPHQLLQDEEAVGHGTATNPQQQRARRRLLNIAEDVGQREMMDSRCLLVLNIVRNLSMIGANEKAIADHEDLCVFLILALRCTKDRHEEIADNVLDILCNISKRIDFLSLHPPTALQTWHPSYQLASHLWKKERLLPLECLLQQLRRMLLDARAKRSVVLRTCELLCSVCRDRSVQSLLSKSPSLQDPVLLDRVVSLLACTRDDFIYAGSSARKKHQTQHGGFPMDQDYDMDDSDDDGDVTDGEDSTSKWPAPWENDGLASGVGMGVVYVSSEGNRNSLLSSHHHHSNGETEDLKFDHEMRDAAMEVLFRLSDGDDAAKLRLAQHPTCLARMAGLLTSCIGRPEASRIVVATLSNLSMNRETFRYFLSIETDLILVACSDRSVSDILNNVVADVFGMHSL